PAPVFRYVTQQIIEVRNLDMSIATKATWRAAVDAMARNLQELIADSFSVELVRGDRLLRPNQPRYDRWKITRGYDPRRGHLRGRLQSRLEGKRLFIITAMQIGRNGLGRCRIIFSDER